MFSEKKGRGRPRKNPIVVEDEEGQEIEIVDTEKNDDDEEAEEKPQRRKSIKKTNKKPELYVEVTQVVDNAGSCRFGFDRRDPDTLCMFLGPLPDVYPIMHITPNKNRQGHATRKAFEDAARQAQEAATAIYAMAKDVRPKTFQGLVALIRENLGESTNEVSE